MDKKSMFISFILTVCLLTATTFSSYASTEIDETTGLPEIQDHVILQTIETADGDTYYIKSNIVDGVRMVEVSSDLNTDVIIVTNDNMEELTFATYSLEDDGINSTPLDDMYSIDEQTYSMDELVDQTEASGSIYYEKTYYETYKSKYYYAIGRSSYGNSYMSIGGVGRYDIKYWALSYTQQRKCDAYTQEIRNVRTHTNNAAVYFAGVGVSVDAALIIAVGFSIVVPEAVIIAAVLAALGVAGSGVRQILDARADYFDAVAIYSIIRTYPHL